MSLSSASSTGQPVPRFSETETSRLLVEASRLLSSVAPYLRQLSAAILHCDHSCVDVWRKLQDDHREESRQLERVKEKRALLQLLYNEHQVLLVVFSVRSFFVSFCLFYRLI